MLNAAIDNWTALGNISSLGLREGFIKREGKLHQQKEGWLLQIESSTIDILLDKISWNMSIVKFPWLKKIIWVEWR